MTRGVRAARTLELALFGFVVLQTTAARADPPMAEATLQYDRRPGAEACPDETALRGQIEVRLGYDPFRAGAPRKVSVGIAPRPGGLRAHIETTDENGAGTFVRDIDGEGSECAELAKSVVLAVSLAIDPMSFAGPRTAAEAASAPSRPSAPALSPPVGPAPLVAASSRPDAEAGTSTAGSAGEAPALPPSADARADRAAGGAREPFRVELLGSIRTGFGLVPAPSVGPAMDVFFGPKAWALVAEASADLPTGTAQLGQTGSGVEATLFRGGLGACGRPVWLLVCARFDVGGLHGSGTAVNVATGQTTLYADVTAFAGVRLAASEHFRAVAGGELVFPVNPTTLYLNGSTPAWSTPTVAGALDLGFAYAF